LIISKKYIISDIYLHQVEKHTIFGNITSEVIQIVIKP